jgi:hypothetical protein
MHEQSVRASWLLEGALCLASDAVVVHVEVLRIGQQHVELPVGDVRAVQFRRSGGMQTPGYAGSDRCSSATGQACHGPRP